MRLCDLKPRFSGYPCSSLLIPKPREKKKNHPNSTKTKHNNPQPQSHKDYEFIKELITEKLKYPNKDTNFQWNSCKRETKEKKNLTDSEISSMSITY